ncbi:MAG: hypothetical protein ACRDSZ_16335 [Pseudonocardiaceae bacterium]
MRTTRDGRARLKALVIYEVSEVLSVQRRQWHVVTKQDEVFDLDTSALALDMTNFATYLDTVSRR